MNPYYGIFFSNDEINRCNAIYLLINYFFLLAMLYEPRPVLNLYYNSTLPRWSAFSCIIKIYISAKLLSPNPKLLQTGKETIYVYEVLRRHMYWPALSMILYLAPSSNLLLDALSGTLMAIC